MTTTITKAEFVNLTLEDKLAYLFERSQLTVELYQIDGGCSSSEIKPLHLDAPVTDGTELHKTFDCSCALYRNLWDKKWIKQTPVLKKDHADMADYLWLRGQGFEALIHEKLAE